MDAQRFAIVIKVNDLNNCRFFYRELLELGEPVVDSSYAVSFELMPGFRLILEKSAAPYLEHASAAASLLFTVSDLDRLRRRLEDAGYTPAFDNNPHLGGFLIGSDPEGNLFRVRESYPTDLPEK